MPAETEELQPVGVDSEAGARRSISLTASVQARVVDLGGPSAPRARPRGDDGHGAQDT